MEILNYINGAWIKPTVKVYFDEKPDRFYCEESPSDF